MRGYVELWAEVVAAIHIQPWDDDLYDATFELRLARLAAEGLLSPPAVAGLLRCYAGTLAIILDRRPEDTDAFSLIERVRELIPDPFSEE
jgi:hypothetical protein